jgi:pectinesterase
VNANSVYLGRPWRSYARVVYQYTDLSSIISSAGWEQWSSSSPNTGNVYFGEYKNTGAGSKGTRAIFSRKLSSAVDISTILGTVSDWVDTSYLK